MSVSLPGGGRRTGRRASSAAGDLNLVPYIDLLTCMIAFLLITAGWAQVSSLQAKQRGGDGDEAAPASMKLTVLVGADGFNVVAGVDRQILPRLERRLDYKALAAALSRVKREHPDKDDALVAPEDQIDFETVVETMDTVLGAGFPAVALVEARSAGP
jgi:biopolymer transport protein TolR